MRLFRLAHIPFFISEPLRVGPRPGDGMRGSGPAKFVDWYGLPGLVANRRPRQNLNRKVLG